MAVSLQAYKLELELSAGVWTDVWADVLGSETLHWARGIMGAKPTDRTAGTGKLEFSLRNGTNSSGGLLGYYTVGHANCRTGFRVGIGVRLKLEYGGTWRTEFTGRLKTATPVPGSYDKRTVSCVALDWMAEAAIAKLRLLAVSASVRSDVVISNCLANMTRQPTATSLDAGIETFAYAPDLAADERTSVLSVLNSVAMSEFGYLYVKGDGTLEFQNRHHRVKDTTIKATITNPRSPQVEHDQDSVANIIKATTNPREVGVVNEILATLRGTLEISAGATETVELRYGDPSNRDVRISGLDIVTPVAGTDFTFDIGNGNLGIVITKGGNSAKLALTNNGGTLGTVTFLQVRGKAIRTYDPVTRVAEDATSKDDYGDRVLELPLTYQSSARVGQDFADITLAKTKLPTTVLKSIQVFGDNSDAEMLAALDVDLGDKVRVEEPVSAIDDDYCINGLEGWLIGGQRLLVSWVPVRASAASYWLLGTAGSGELGIATTLGF